MGEQQDQVGWAIVEMLGHRRVAGYVSEVQLAGAGFLRLDLPATEGHGEQTQYLSPGSLYAVHPVSEETARAAAAAWRPAPVSRWELPAAREPRAVPGDGWESSADLDPDDDPPFG